MFLFDWKKIYNVTEGNIYHCNLVMEMLIKKSVPKNKYDPIYRFFEMDFHGHSFMLHPDLLLYHSYKYPVRDISVYYALASLRSLPEYIVSQKITLDLLHLPVGLDLIIDNRLLTIDYDSIHFLYEEVTTENIH
jgi:hypothetical protein|tara:strand:+ start:324 stop:725 length:402 start_codon:yes stop_codon:yes gene_type:complete